MERYWDEFNKKGKGQQRKRFAHLPAPQLTQAVAPAAVKVPTAQRSQGTDPNPASDTTPPPLLPLLPPPPLPLLPPPPLPPLPPNPPPSPLRFSSPLPAPAA